jgi:hypothetical protein
MEFLIFATVILTYGCSYCIHALNYLKDCEDDVIRRRQQQHHYVGNPDWATVNTGWPDLNKHNTKKVNWKRDGF